MPGIWHRHFLQHFMGKNNAVKIFRKLHKWPGIIIAFIAVLFAASGIVLNHRQFFYSTDISRNLLPPNYRYENWNLSSVRGSLPIENNRMLIYGNIGVWETSYSLDSFTDFNQGFPKGIDNRKIYSVAAFDNTFFAGTHFGLYNRAVTANKWEKIHLPVKQERIADINMKEDTLLVLTRHYLLKTVDGKDFETVQLPEPEGYERKTGLFNTLWEVHSGELWGLPGKIIVDLLGLVTIFLAVTGLLHLFFPKIIKRRKRKEKQVKLLAGIFKTNLHWHNVAGYIFVVFLVINTLAGIHLRPPLLIPIANKKVGIIPGTHLDNPNPWFDKLRRVAWDEDLNRYIFSTSEGFFTAEETLAGRLKHIVPEPPVSIMGLNVFKSLGEQKYLTGSFNGMYVWNLKSGGIHDFYTGKPYSPPQGISSPVGVNMIAGLIEAGENAWWFDYNRGALPLSGKFFPEMPEEILENSPVSLWNTSLEIHTGRIFEHIIGPFYILYVPLAGLCLIIVLVSGFFIWWKVYRS